MSRLLFFIAFGISVLPTAASAEVRLLDTPAAEMSSSYALNAGPDGTIVLSWVERLGEGGHALRFAELQGEKWGPATTIARGKNWFVNWIDHLAVVQLPGDRLAAHWLVHDEDREGDYGYGIRLAFSEDRGETWREVFQASGDGVDGYAGFVAYAPAADGFEMAYLATVGDDNAEPASAGHGEAEPRMALRSARFDAAGALVGDREVDADVCSCCTTAMAPSSDGLFLAFRDRREGEFRDISFARLRDERWSSPKLVHRDGWHIRGCPTNGPALASSASGPAVAWFTAAGGESKVLAAFWNTTEQRFDDPIRIDHGSPRGWAGVATLEDGSAAVSWVERSETGHFELRVRRVSQDEGAGTPLTVAPVPAGRSAVGVPKLVRGEGRLVFAWRDGGVRTAAIPASILD
ncbi:MAG: hypothetical protein F4112_12750 [Holophagales bacterium]|nr:hypothetical protein [Holophagales bacterium]MYD22563.1 hypothetical protein [Holophagales bacterium]MYI33821.1 hypothetical protein [Holophagales bacterium]